MSVSMRCKAHPRYAAQRMPPKTVVNPDGCPTCWGVWEHAKADPKRLVPVVAIEMSPDEARQAALALSRCRHDGDPMVVRLLQLLTTAVRGA